MEMPPDVAASAGELHLLLERVRLSESKKRESVGAVQEAIKAAEPHVREFMERARLSSQRLEFGERVYRIVKRTYVTRPRITLPRLEELLTETVSEIPTEDPMQRLEDVLRNLVVKMTSLEMKSTERVVFQEITKKGEEGEDEEDDEGGTAQL
jgi:hypothetical protein